MTRKKRHPKPVLNPLAVLAPLRSPEVQRIMLHYYMALEKLTSGMGEERDLFTLLKVCELVYIALGSGTFVDVEDAIEAVSQTAIGLRHAASRVEDGARAGIDGATYQTLKRMLAQIEDVFKTTSVAVVRRWLDEQERSIRTGVFQSLNPPSKLLAPLDATGVHNLGTYDHPVVITTGTAWGVLNPAI